MSVDGFTEQAKVSVDGVTVKVIAVTPVSAGPVPFDAQTRSLFESVATSIDSGQAVLDFSTGGKLPAYWLSQLAKVSHDRVTAEARAAYLRSWVDGDYRDLVRGCKGAVLVIVGQNDPAITAATCTAAFGELFGNLTVEEMGNAGHYPMDETPLLLGTRINSFIGT